MPDVGVPELLIIAVIVLLLFGPGKAADIGGALGKSIREFRKASHEEDGHVAPTVLQSAGNPEGHASAQNVAALNAQPVSRHCTECGAAIRQSDKFCMDCGARVVTATQSG